MRSLVDTSLIAMRSRIDEQAKSQRSLDERLLDIAQKHIGNAGEPKLLSIAAQTLQTTLDEVVASMTPLRSRIDELSRCQQCMDERLQDTAQKQHGSARELKFLSDAIRALQSTVDEVQRGAHSRANEEETQYFVSLLARKIGSQEQLCQNFSTCFNEFQTRLGSVDERLNGLAIKYDEHSEHLEALYIRTDSLRSTRLKTYSDSDSVAKTLEVPVDVVRLNIVGREQFCERLDAQLKDVSRKHDECEMPLKAFAERSDSLASAVEDQGVSLLSASSEVGVPVTDLRPHNDATRALAAIREDVAGLAPLHDSLQQDLSCQGITCNIERLSTVVARKAPFATASTVPTLPKPSPAQHPCKDIIDESCAIINEHRDTETPRDQPSKTSRYADSTFFIGAITMRRAIIFLLLALVVAIIRSMAPWEA